MARTDTHVSQEGVWFAYDGDCPLCTAAARALRIRRDVGSLHLINARENPEHPLIGEINARGLDLDDGMVLKFRGICYHGRDALHMMALLGSEKGWFNRTNALLFRSKALARLLYPAMRAVRNLLLRLKGIDKIHNLQPNAGNAAPIFQAVFGSDWDRLPRVMRDHYAVRARSGDTVTVKGALDVEVSRFVAVMSRLTGMLVSRSGENVPVTVTFSSGPGGAAFRFDRVFQYPGGDVHFRSCMEIVGGNELIEFMGWGIGWKMAYAWDGEKVILAHRGYVWRIFGIHVPVPLALVIGKARAEEIPLSDGQFRMWTRLEHPWFGTTLAYGGTFTITEVACPTVP